MQYPSTSERDPPRKYSLTNSLHLWWLFCVQFSSVHLVGDLQHICLLLLDRKQIIKIHSSLQTLNPLSLSSPALHIFVHRMNLKMLYLYVHCNREDTNPFIIRTQSGHFQESFIFKTESSNSMCLFSVVTLKHKAIIILVCNVLCHCSFTLLLEFWVN